MTISNEFSRTEENYLKYMAELYLEHLSTNSASTEPRVRVYHLLQKLNLNFSAKQCGVSQKQLKMVAKANLNKIIALTKPVKNWGKTGSQQQKQLNQTINAFVSENMSQAISAAKNNKLPKSLLKQANNDFNKHNVDNIAKAMVKYNVIRILPRKNTALWENFLDWDDNDINKFLINTHQKCHDVNGIGYLVLNA